MGKSEKATLNISNALFDADIGWQAGQVAWILIYHSLLHATAELLEDSQDLFDFDKVPDEQQQAEFASILEDHLLHTNVKITHNFFEKPSDFAFLQDFKHGLKHWLVSLGLEEVQTDALLGRLPYKFTLSLHSEWLSQPEHYELIKQAIDTPFTKAVGKEREWQHYHAQLQEQINKRMFGEAFSLRQVYVPLRAYYEEKVQDNDEDDLRHSDKKKKIAVCLHQELENWVRLYDKDDTLRVIRGGPGSGKSSFCKMFAADIAGQLGIRVLFIPLHLIDPEDDLQKEVKSLLEVYKLTADPFDSSTNTHLLVIFDGLDELAMQGKAAAEVAQNFLEKVLRLADRFSYSPSLKCQFLISGRDLVVQANENRFRKTQQILHVLPYYLTESEQKDFTDLNDLLSINQRHEWWGKYAKVKGKDFDAMPAELQQDNLIEITSQPLLNYLVALSHNRGKLDFTRQTTLNEIYKDLLEAVYQRKWDPAKKHRSLGNLEQSRFSRILEEIALAVWHGDGRTATVDYIEQRCKSSHLIKYFEVFQEGAKQGVTRLLTAFYFRQAGDVKGEKTFEFTHKSFGEYLTAKRLVGVMEQIQEELEDKEKNPDKGWDDKDALKRWAEICGATAIDDYLYSFIKNEVALRKESEVQKWQVTLCRLIEFCTTHGTPMEELKLDSFQTMLNQSRNAEEALLVMHSACANVTKQVLEIKWASTTTFGTWLYKLQGQRKSGGSVLALNCLQYIDLKGCSLVIHDFYEANLEQANLGGANLDGANLREVNLDRAYLKWANLEGANLERAYLDGANFREANLEGANLEGANLEGANLDGAIGLEKAYFRKEDLEGAILPEGFKRE